MKSRLASVLDSTERGLLAVLLPLSIGLGLVFGTDPSLLDFTGAQLVVGGVLVLAFSALAFLRTRWAIYILVLAAPNPQILEFGRGVFALNPFLLLFSLFTVVGGFKILVTGHHLFSLRIALPYLGFLALAAVTIPLSPVSGESARLWFRFLGYFVLYVQVVQEFDNDKHLRRLANAIVISSMVPLAASINQWATRTGQIEDYGKGLILNRLAGFTAGPFSLSYYLVVVLAFAVMFLLDVETRRRLKFLWYGPVAALSAAVIWLSYYRSAWLALALVILCSGLFFDRRLLVGLIVLSGPLIFAADFQERFLRLFDEGSMYGRLAHWRFAWSWFKARPFLGNGLGSYAHALSYYNPVQSLQGSNAHSLVFTFLADVGLLGTMTFFSVLSIVLFRSVRSTFRQWRLERRVGVSFAAMLVLVGFLPGIVVSNVMLLGVPTAFAWIAFAMLGAREGMRISKVSELEEAR